MEANSLGAINAYTKALDQIKDGKGSEPGANSASGFSSLVNGLIGDTVDATAKSETAGISAVSGTGDLVDVVTSVANAEIVVETVVAVRDRVIQAYNDIIRMPL